MFTLNKYSILYMNHSNIVRSFHHSIVYAVAVAVDVLILIVCVVASNSLVRFINCFFPYCHTRAR